MPKGIDMIDGNIRILLTTSKSWAGFNVSPPMGLYRLKYVLENNGFDCDIFDFDVDSENDLHDLVKSGCYDLIGMSVTHVNMQDDLDALLTLKILPKRKTVIAVGGQSASMNYRQWLESGVVDICFLGFAETNLVKFCQILARWGIGYFRKIAGRVKGVAFVDCDGRICRIPSERLTQEEFVMLSFENAKKMIMPYPRYWNVMAAKKNNQFNNAAFTIKTSRLYTSSHCSRQCGFCSSQSFIPSSQDSASPIFMLSAEEVFELVCDSIDKYGTQAFLFSDDNFLVGTAKGILRLEQFCEMVSDAKMGGKLPYEISFFCQSRVADFIRRDKRMHVLASGLIAKMKKAGFRNIGLGIETFSPRLLKVGSINKIGVTTDDCHDVIEGLLKAGIVPQLFIILGIPESTTDELVHTMRIAVNYIVRGADIAVISKMRAYPGAPVVESGQYQLAYKQWTNNLGKVISIADHVIPNDQRIDAILPKVDELTEVVIDEIRKEHQLPKDAIISKSLVGISSFIATARLINRRDIEMEFKKVVDQTIVR
jgi:radical SAM superfamily enzyme YgiQ (UPF0313 family)